jgi:hypothetical protein
MADNSISTLFKIVLFQNDGGALVTAELVNKLLTELLPIKNDIEEAGSVHTLFLQHVLNKNAILLNAEAQTKQCIQNIKAYAEAHTDAEEDILGDKGKALMQ